MRERSPLGRPPCTSAIAIWHDCCCPSFRFRPHVAPSAPASHGPRHELTLLRVLVCSDRRSLHRSLHHRSLHQSTIDRSTIGRSSSIGHSSHDRRSFTRALCRRSRYCYTTAACATTALALPTLVITTLALPMLTLPPLALYSRCSWLCTTLYTNCCLLYCRAHCHLRYRCAH